MFKKLLKMPKKYPLITGVVIVGIYFMFAGKIKAMISSGVSAVQQQKTELLKKEMNPEPEMIDSSMFDESISFNATIAKVDSQLEDTINAVHK